MAILPFIWTAVFHQLLALAQSYQLHHGPVNPVYVEEDPGTPLFLTPYIESGKIDEAKFLSRVPLTEIKTLGFKSYAGFLTVNKTYNSNQFFWYFPAMNNDPDAPVLVWLQGGPGASSLFGLIAEHGPLTVKDGKFQRRKHHWAYNHHVIYIDNPVGAGFSFTNDSRGYCTDQIQVGDQLYSAIVQFFQLFPELKKNKFSVSGESYGGKYVPALAYAIHKKNPTAQVKINLKGMAIGNGMSDPENQLQFSTFLEQIGLLGWNEAKKVEVQQNKIISLIRKQEWLEAFKAFNELLMSKNSLLVNLTGVVDRFDNYLSVSNFDIDYYVPVLNRNSVRKSLHVGDLEFNNFKQEVFNTLSEDILKSVAPWISELLEHYYVLVYHGQLDIGSAYSLALDYLRKLNHSGAEEYRDAERRVWWVEGEVAGYTRQGGKLIDVMIRNAGHMVPKDQPEYALAMISSFIQNYTVSDVEFRYV